MDEYTQIINDAFQDVFIKELQKKLPEGFSIIQDEKSISLVIKEKDKVIQVEKTQKKLNPNFNKSIDGKRDTNQFITETILMDKKIKITRNPQDGLIFYHKIINNGDLAVEMFKKVNVILEDMLLKNPNI